MAAPTILIVDDEVSILTVFSLALRAEGYEVFTAGSAMSGLETARTLQPRLILCDVHMPGTDGKGLLQMLRADPSLASTQIVLMTGNPQAATPREGMEIGADDFLLKPVDRESLLRCVAARLRRADEREQAEARLLEDIRTDLRAILPHELLTPLSGVVGITRILREDWRNLPPPEVDDLLASLDESGARLERTLRNYLQLVDLQDAPLPEPAAPMDAREAADLLGATAHAVAERHHRAGDLDATALVPAPVRIRETDLSVIAEELIENAFGFSKPGSTVEVVFTRDGRLTVSDSGRGMDPEKTRAIRAFKQFDRKDFEQQGLGLGLLLVHRIADRSGARISLDSEPGRGTRVTVEFRVSNPTKHNT